MWISEYLQGRILVHEIDNLYTFTQVMTGVFDKKKL